MFTFKNFALWCNHTFTVISSYSTSLINNVMYIAKTYPVINESKKLCNNFLSFVLAYQNDYEQSHKYIEWYMYPYFYFQAANCILYVGCLYAFSLFRTTFISYWNANKSNHKIKYSKEKIEIEYSIKSSSYTVVVPVKFIVQEYKNATTRINEDIIFDVTEKIKKVLGPNEDWHNQKLTPKLLGYNNLTISKFDNDSFEEVTREFGADTQLLSLCDMK